jgi:23S rRNA (guanosine2251-2'-O)-methyltransferase
MSELEVATEPLCLVVGSEGAGMSRIVTQACDVVARIPIARDVESLNAGVAAGIALYEISRARR